MDVSQGQVGQAAGGDVLQGDGAVASLPLHVPMEGHQVDAPVPWGGKAHQGRAVGLGGGKGRAVHHAVEAGQLHPLHRHGGKDMYVVRPRRAGVHRTGAVAVMVARGDEHRGGDAPQGPGQGLYGLLVGLAAVQQVSGEQHHVRPPLLRQPGQPVQQLPLLGPAGPGLVRGQGGKRGVQVEIRPVDDCQHRCLGSFLAGDITRGCPPARRSRTAAGRCRWRRVRSPAYRGPGRAQSGGAARPESG